MNIDKEKFEIILTKTITPSVIFIFAHRLKNI